MLYSYNMFSALLSMCLDLEFLVVKEKDFFHVFPIVFVSSHKSKIQIELKDVSESFDMYVKHIIK